MRTQTGVHSSAGQQNCVGCTADGRGYLNTMNRIMSIAYEGKIMFAKPSYLNFRPVGLCVVIASSLWEAPHTSQRFGRSLMTIKQHIEHVDRAQNPGYRTSDAVSASVQWSPLRCPLQPRLRRGLPGRESLPILVPKLCQALGTLKTAVGSVGYPYTIDCHRDVYDRVMHVISIDYFLQH